MFLNLMRLRLRPEQLLPSKQLVKQFNVSAFDNADIEAFLKELQQKPEPRDLSNSQNIHETIKPSSSFKSFLLKFIPKIFRQ